MSFGAIEGNPVHALQDASSVVITERTAKKLFGNENSMGKTILLDSTHVFKVAAVVRDVPSNSTVQFDMVLPFKVYESENTG